MTTAVTTSSSLLSLVLGSAIIIIAFGGWFYILHLMKNKDMETTRIDKIAKLGQWVIASVAIVVTGFIVSDTFKERQQQLRELEFFDKYVGTVTLAKGVEQRWLLCQYFASVAPRGEFRTAWKNYQRCIQADYEDFKRTQAELDSLSKVAATMNHPDSVRMQFLSRKIDRQMQSLISLKDLPQLP